MKTIDERGDYKLVRLSAYNGNTTEQVEWCVTKDDKVKHVSATLRNARVMFDIYTLDQEAVFAKHPSLRAIPLA